MDRYSPYSLRNPIAQQEVSGSKSGVGGARLVSATDVPHGPCGPHLGHDDPQHAEQPPGLLLQALEGDSYRDTH